WVLSIRKSSGFISNAGVVVTSWSVVANSSITVQSADGLRVLGTGSSVSYSTAIANAATFAALELGGASSSTVTECFFSNPPGVGVSFTYDPSNTNLRAAYNTVSASRINTNGSQYALFSYLSSYNTVTQSFISNPAGIALDLDRSDYTTISQSTITSYSGSVFAMQIFKGSTNTVVDSYIQGGVEAVSVNDSTGPTIINSVLVATAPGGTGLTLKGVSTGLTLSSSTILTGSSGSGIWLDSGNKGYLNISSAVFRGSRYGLKIDAQDAACELAISSLTFQGLASGATAIHFLGGTFVSTFNAVSFADMSIAVNVNAAALAEGSRISMRSTVLKI
ncbi:MAG: right-handed parallel beta-helix repeat-containing protein, partial [Elusimicrobiota bacterium]